MSSSSSLSRVPAKPLSPYLRSLKEKASNGGIKDRAVGRDEEIKKVSVSLLRRRKPNCMLVGEAGTGKTAIVEELAHRIFEKSSAHLQDVEIFELDLNGLIAGTRNRGEFEQRTTDIIKILEEQTSKGTDAVLFIDEFHTACSTEGAEDTSSFLSILKPALARGNLRCIGATTYDEYTKHVLPDGALNRRFTCIDVPELDDEKTLEAVLSVKKSYEEHHKCVYSMECVKACISISNRLFHYRCQPDKSLDLLDEIGSNIAILNKQRLRDPNCKVSKEDVVNFCVDCLKLNVDGYGDDIESDKLRLAKIEATLSNEIIGQSHAVNSLCRALMRKRLNMCNVRRPVASFLLLGPSASGKTRLSTLFGDLYFDSTLRLDMSEYQEKHAVSSLIGAPPGYEAFDEGGRLTNFIKYHPYSLILFDELDKAHPNVINLLLQILEDGRLKDGTGKLHDFTNTIVVMTSSIHSNENEGIGFFAGEQEDRVMCDPRDMLTNTFKPEFINRIDEVLELTKLSDGHLRDIVKGHLSRKLSEVVAKYPMFQEECATFDVEEHVEHVFHLTKEKNARELSNNAEKYVVDLFVEKIFNLTSTSSTSSTFSTSR